MKKLLFLILVAALSSCSSHIDRMFDLYIQIESATSVSDSIRYTEMFKRAALHLTPEELKELDAKIKEHIAERELRKEDYKTRSKMIKNILEYESNN